ncbi:MAG: tRNA uridine-5-carboxymethylaminomethyl(34) synthesis GTPase MnmE [Gammaproteobacteria bacterium]|nr:tRNA uridine-5-carboxymethylaminomethyl(34) synthesis GTPase MnmE [Gammaproteobacteria bacterium]
MNATAPDSIVAAATAPGRGAIGIVRVSGPRAAEVAEAVLGGLPAPREGTLRAFRDAEGRVIDTGIALYFPAPHSYTGEALLELQGHGGPVVLELLVARALQLGCRRARPGEFTERAYLNGKLDLAQAEAVIDLIDAASDAGARAAVRSLQGEFSAAVHELTGQLTALRVLVEAAIDFAEEDIEHLGEHGLVAGIAGLDAQFAALLARGRQGRLLTEGLTIVIAGRPNVGKSTLLNRLAGHEAAIVSAEPGTTRDLLRERILIDGMPLHIIDTAGLREGGGAIELEGMRRARAVMAAADRVLLLLDAAGDPPVNTPDALAAELPAGIPVTIVCNKCDLLPGPWPADTGTRIHLSAATGQGVDALRAHLRQVAGLAAAGEGTLSARARHVDALEAARSHVLAAAQELAGGRAPELIAEELRLAQRELGTITGEVSADELLGRIFGEFCIGK